MIAFVCSQCGKKFQVKLEFAGRSTRCPSCKQGMVVPDAPTETGAFPERIDGPRTGLADAGVREGVTLDQAGTVLHPGQKSVLELLSRRTRKGERYIIENEIARGGMGAVLRAVDCDIRREVAVKYLLDQTDASKKLRFVEEAQVTGQLEHPNIVPIHELGSDAQGRVFFSMKMVKGRSLAQVLDEGRGVRGEGGEAKSKEDPSRSSSPAPHPPSRPSPLAPRPSSLSRLLTILINVCHALAYAHARGVIHRDLKPANIMVGDFGEVYVMDWGLAKIVKARPEQESQQNGSSAVGSLTSEEHQQGTLPADVGPASENATATMSLAGVTAPPQSTLTSVSPVSSGSDVRIVTDRMLQAEMTQDGAILGTPVYMPPEQALGQLEAIDQRSDIYALGAILYEILTLQPPVATEGGSPAILKRVAAGEIVPPARRVRQSGSKRRVPPELAAVTLKALARDPAQRYPSVEAFRQDLERYLEGRSVSAKEDSTREVLVKFIKRNKGLSAGIAAAFLILVGSLVLISNAWLAANETYASAQAEEEAKNNKGRKLVPAFVRAARLMANEKKFTDALAQVEVAVRFEPNDVAARLLRAQLLIGEQRFEEAEQDLDVCVAERGGSEPARKLAALCRRARHDPATLPLLAAELARQKAHTLAGRLIQEADKSPSAQPDLITNTIGMKLQRIQAGKFLMGSSATEIEKRKKDRPFWVPPALVQAEGPRHEVRISRPFHMGVHEVTVGQFRQFVQATGYKTHAEKMGRKNHWLSPGFAERVAAWHSSNKRSDKTIWNNPSFEQGDEHPVVCVTWNDAKEFCDWLSSKEGKTYRLPTEAEWEYACRAGTTTAYSCGDASSALQGAANVGGDSGMEAKEASVDRHTRWFTTPVGRFAPNAFGLYDMHGNVWEWVADRYAADYYSRSPAQDPKGPDTGTERVFRGGSWMCQPYGGWTVRAAHRLPSSPDKAENHIGFRVLLDSQSDGARAAQNLAQYRAVIEEAWPGSGARLTVDERGRFSLSLAGMGEKVRHLERLQGLPLSSLDLTSCTALRDLTPLAGMPLTALHLANTQVADLTPLAGMKLTFLNLDGTRVPDLTPLEGMPLQSLYLNVCRQLTDLTPLRGMKLTLLSLRNTEIRDLTPLKNMPLRHLDLGWSPQVRGLAPLAGMKLNHLGLPNSTIDKDLSLFTGMPLTSLDIASCSQVHDLAWVKQFKLHSLSLPATTTDKDMLLLKDIPLINLHLGVCNQVRDLTPLKGRKFAHLTLWYTSVTDLTPLEGMPLGNIGLPPPRNVKKGMEMLRRMKSLHTISTSWEAHLNWPAAEFWKKYDAGQFK